MSQHLPLVAAQPRHLDGRKTVGFTLRLERGALR